MWQRFTERARRVVFFAQEEAGRLGEANVCTEHLLLGLVRENDSAAARVLEGAGLSLDLIRTEIEQQAVRGGGRRPGQDMQLAPRSKRVIDLAYDEARQSDKHYVGSEHLLLGLLREGEGLAGRVLSNLGLELERTREAVRALPQQAAEPRTVPARSERPIRAAHPDIGDLGVLRNADGRDIVEVCVDEEAYGQLIDVYQALDHHGYRVLAEQGRMFLVGSGTHAKFLQNPPDNDPSLTQHAWYVRILTGEHTGRAGWVVRQDFERTGPDTSPFPPPT